MLNSARSGVLIALLAVPLVADAMVIMDMELTCPVGGERFETGMALSGSQFGQNLDRRPLGPIASPWPLAKCPGNGFVIYKDEFSPGELEALTSYVESAAYQQLQETESTYYVAANLMRRLDESPSLIAHALLKATWQVEKDSRYRAYAEEALAAFEGLLQEPNSGLTMEERHSYQQIAGELERRLGRFDAALTRFHALAADPGIVGTDLERIVRQEIRLVEAGDSTTQAVESAAAGER